MSEHRRSLDLIKDLWDDLNPRDRRQIEALKEAIEMDLVHAYVKGRLKGMLDCDE